MAETISISTLQSYTAKKLKKKILIKVIWNEQGKVTLFITPNMKISSFIFDEKEGYLFYDQEGKQVNYDIPCILAPENIKDGQVKLDGNLQINGSPLTNEDITFLKEEGANGK
ncbi:hypothetical protein [Virgibacillus kimchii]